MKLVSPYKVGNRILKKNEKIFYKHIYEKLRGKTEEIPVIKRAKGPYLYDFDNNRYVDFYMSGGNLLMGHVVPRFTHVVKSWFNRGYSLGYPFLQSNQMLASKLSKVVEVYKGNNYIMMFLNSTEDGLITTLHFLKMIGLNRGGYIASPIIGRIYNIFGMENVVDNHVDEKYDYLFLKPASFKMFNQIRAIINRIKSEGTIVILDESDFSSVYFQYISGDWLNADIRIVGNWISSGYDFGSIIIRKDLLSSFCKNENSLLYYLNDIKFPPLYKIKGAIEFLSNLDKKGGIKAINEIQINFMRNLKNSYFVMEGGLIFIDIKKIKDYDKFWFSMLRYGYYMPYTYELPLFINLSWDRDLINKVSKNINNLNF